jgi:Domain of unknown function (DUF4331)
VFDVSFDAPSLDNGAVARQHGTCTTSTGSSVELTVDDERGGCRDGLRVFAGLRSDPFFIDLPAFQETVISGRNAFREVGQNSLAGCNVLSVVVEAECAPLVEAAGGSLFAVVGETVTAGKLPIRIERVGRPEIKNVIMSWKEYDTVNRDLEIRDLYNLEDVFHMGKDYRDAYRARLNANLAVFDRVGGSIDWPSANGGSHPLTELLLNDYLVVDITKPFSGDSFLEIERAMLAGRAHTTCGGRSLNDDVMDTWYALLIDGLDAPRMCDGVDGATVPATGAFPYLAPPTPEPTKVTPEPGEANPEPRRGAGSS